jgi:hypothetical protein
MRTFERRIGSPGRRPAVEGSPPRRGGLAGGEGARADRPTDCVVLTTHAITRGAPGRGRAPALLSTAATRGELARRAAARGETSPAAGILEGERVRLVDGGETTLDLGGRRVRIVPRSGHTRSDLAVVVDDPRLVWCGDLVWNVLFPNYVDATPSDSRPCAPAEPAERCSWHGDLLIGLWSPFLSPFSIVEAAARHALRRAPAADAEPPVRP